MDIMHLETVFSAHNCVSEPLWKSLVIQVKIHPAYHKEHHLKGKKTCVCVRESLMLAQRWSKPFFDENEMETAGWDLLP